MSTEIRVPTLGESVTEATVAKWLKAEGDKVTADEPLVELETDKVSVEVPAPASGILSEIAVQEGDTVGVDALLGAIGEAGSKSSSQKSGSQTSGSQKSGAKPGKDPGPKVQKDAGTEQKGERLEVLVPEGGESVTEADIGEWLVKEGDTVGVDQALVSLETDKAAMDVAAPAAGVVKEIHGKEGDTVPVGALLVVIETGGASRSGANGASAGNGSASDAAREPDAASNAPTPREVAMSGKSNMSNDNKTLSPAPRRVVAERNLDPTLIDGSGKGGRVTKGDALAAKTPAAPSARAPAPAGEREERVKMSRLRQTIARRLKQAQDEAAMLTTFNDVDMTAVMELRAQYKDLFQKKHGIKLGFMSFFVKACCHALREVPEVNAEIDGTDIIYKDHYDVSIAVGTDKGLVVPVLRDADLMSLAEIELAIADFGARARSGDLKIEEMQGGTFSITNGGIYGSLMSTPILNPPQSGILGMHRIEERPVAINGEVKIRPMMYLALSYDHRIVDGKGAVTFLVRVKENLEDPQRLLLDL